MPAYYNEHDPFAAQWLRNLIAVGHIAPGDVDERSNVDVRPDDLAGYTQCHFFAGIGVWSHALRRAGWSDDRPVWTGSCPCQPFSAAGKGGGFDDERHLWPAFFHLIEQCRPHVVFGEQVASKDGLAWLDLVQADLEGTGYATGALDLCAAGFGAPHIRQRLYWVAEGLDDTAGARHEWAQQVAERNSRDQARLRVLCAGSRSGLVADAEHDGLRQHGDGLGGTARASEGEVWARPQRLRPDPADGFATGLMADADDAERRSDPAGRHERDRPHAERPQGASHVEGCGGDLRPGPTNGFWRDADWLHCRDGKWRPVRPGSFPLAHGASSRVGRLRAYGNAIVTAQAEAFIGAFMQREDLTP